MHGFVIKKERDKKKNSITTSVLYVGLATIFFTVNVLQKCSVFSFKQCMLCDLYSVTLLLSQGATKHFFLVQAVTQWDR